MFFVHLSMTLTLSRGLRPMSASQQETPTTNEPGQGSLPNCYPPSITPRSQAQATASAREPTPSWL